MDTSMTNCPIKDLVLDGHQWKSSSVCKGKYQNQDVAVKIKPIHFYESSSFERDFRWLQTLKNPYLVKYLLTDSSATNRYIVMELCLGSLTDYFHGDLNLQLQDQEVLWDILSALNYLHKLNIIHGHLHPDHIFLWRRSSVGRRITMKLGHFGFQPSPFVKDSDGHEKTKKNDVKQVAQICHYVFSKGTKPMMNINFFCPLNLSLGLENVLTPTQTDLIRTLIRLSEEEEMDISKSLLHPFFTAVMVEARVRLMTAMNQIGWKEIFQLYLSANELQKWMTNNQHQREELNLETDEADELLHLMEQCSDSDHWDWILEEVFQMAPNLISHFLWFIIVFIFSKKQNVKEANNKFAEKDTVPVASSTSDDDRTTEALVADSFPQMTEMNTVSYIPYEDILVDRSKQLGCGGFGSVYPGRYAGRTVAIKEILTLHQEERIVKEVNIIQELNHIFVIQCFGISKHQHHRYVLLELCEGNLKEYVHHQLTTIPYGLLDDKSILGQTTLGLSYIHSQGIIHKDLKPENILLWKDPHSSHCFAKLADFGLGKKLRPGHAEFTPTQYPGTSGYIAPELLVEEDEYHPTFESDIYSLGILFYFILSKGKHPFGGNNELRNSFITNGIPALNAIDHQWEAVDLILKLIDRDPQNRPNTFLILHHPFFTSSNDISRHHYTLLIYHFINQPNMFNLNRMKFLKLLSKKGVENWYRSIDDQTKEDAEGKLIEQLKQILLKYQDCLYDREKLHFVEEIIMDEDGRNPRQQIKKAIDEDYQKGQYPPQLERMGKVMDLSMLTDLMKKFPKLFSSYSWFCLSSLSLTSKEAQKHFYMTTMIYAIQHQSTDEIKVMLQLGKYENVNQQYVAGKTDLHQVAILSKWMNPSDPSFIRFLFNSEADPGIRDRSKRLVLHYACQGSSSVTMEIVKVLMDKGSNPNEEDGIGKTALHYGCSQDNPSPELIKCLLENKADPGLFDRTGKTPFHYALQHSTPEIIKLLLLYGADPAVPDKKRKSTIHLACSNEHHPSAEILKYLLNQLSDPDVLDGQGKTGLHYICSGKSAHSVEMMKILFHAGCDPKLRDCQQKTALHYLCENNGELSVEMAQLILESGCDPEIPDKNGQTALHCALRSSCPEMIHLLLNKTTHVSKDQKHKTVLHFACENELHPLPEIAEELINKGCDPRAGDSEGRTALHYSCRNNSFLSTETILLLLDKGSDPNTPDKYGKTALHYVCEHEANNAADIAEILLNQRADPETVDALGRTALHYVCLNEGHSAPQLIQIFLSRNVQVNVTDKFGKTPLHYACSNESQYTKQMVELLLINGCDPDVSEKEGKTGLHFACNNQWNSSAETVKILLKKMIHPEISDKQQKNALHYACASDVNLSSEMIKLLLNQGMDPNAMDYYKRTPLHYACENDKSPTADTVRLLLNRGADPDMQDDHGKTALHYACENKWNCTSEILKLVYRHPSQLNVVDKNGKSVLHYAAECSSPEIVQFLVHEECHISAVDNQGRTALHWTCHNFFHDSMDIITILLGKGLNPNSVDKNNKTALHYACANQLNSHPDVVRVLLDQGADPEIRDVKGKTALLYACANDRKPCPAIVQHLLENGADPTLTDPQGRTALHFACKNQIRPSLEIIQLLLDHGADPKSVDDKRKTCLHYASENMWRSNVSIIQLLLDRGCDPEMKDHSGKTAWQYALRFSTPNVIKLFLGNQSFTIHNADKQKTALHYACTNSIHLSVDIISILLTQGWDPSIQDEEEKTALHYACQNGWKSSLEIVRLLLMKQVDPQITDISGKTALHYACENDIRPSVDIVRLLVEQGSNLYAVDKQGKTALHYACNHEWNPSTEIVQLLLDRGCPIEQRDVQGQTALHYACANKIHPSVEIGMLLLNRGIDPNVQDHSGKTALHHACENIHDPRPDIVQCLLSKGSNPLIQDLSGKTPLHYACTSDNVNCLDIVRCLFNRQADPNIQDHSGKTALHYICNNEFQLSMELVQLFLQQGCRPSIKDHQGQTALDYAVQSQDPSPESISKFLSKMKIK